ncbi:hypothetical protein GCM10022227_12860 [Streptomyces sedi]
MADSTSGLEGAEPASRVGGRESGPSAEDVQSIASKVADMEVTLARLERLVAELERTRVTASAGEVGPRRGLRHEP